MAKPKYIGQNQDHDGNELRNFVLWLLTTAQTITKLIKTGHIGYDTQKDKVVVKTSTDLKELAFRESQIEKTSSFTVDSTYDRAEVFISSATPVTVTVNAVSNDFQCQFINIGAGSATFSAGTGTLSTPDGTILAQNKVSTLIKRNASGTIYLKGELTS